jgi:hypothetical protein
MSHQPQVSAQNTINPAYDLATFLGLQGVERVSLFMRVDMTEQYANMENLSLAYVQVASPRPGRPRSGDP